MAKSDVNPEGFTAKREVVVPGAENGLDSFPPMGDDDWYLIGTDAALAKFGGKKGQRIDAEARDRLLNGLHLDGSPVRNPNNVQPDLNQPDKVNGVVQAMGAYRVANDPAFAIAWSAAGPEAKPRIEADLVEMPLPGIAYLAKSDEIAGMASVRGVSDGAVIVEWASFASLDKEGKVISPVHRKAVRSVEPYKPDTVEPVREAAAAPPQQAPAEVVAEPSPAELPVNSPDLPQGPLRDSLTAKLDVLGKDAATNIRNWSKEKAKELQRQGLSTERLREELEGADHFAGMPRDTEALRAWYQANHEAVLHQVACENLLIARGAAAFETLAKDESARRQESRANPLEELRKVHDQASVRKVGHHATVRASEYLLEPPDVRGDRTAELHQKVEAGGYESLDFDEAVDLTALQDVRNLETGYAQGVNQAAPSVDLGRDFD